LDLFNDRLDWVKGLSNKQNLEESSKSRWVDSIVSAISSANLKDFIDGADSHHQRENSQPANHSAYSAPLAETIVQSGF
jgi:hypothetical protein